jgi:hypothetical protein
LTGLPKSGRLPRPLRQPVYGSEDAASAIFRGGDPTNELEAIKWYLQTPQLRAACDYVDSVATSKFGGYKYPRSALLRILVVADVLGIPLTKAHARVQGCKELRKLCGFEPMDKSTRRRQRELRGREPLLEDNFPARQTVSYFVNRWLAQSGCDLVELIRSQTEIVAAQAILDHVLDTSRVAVDGSQVLSPNRSKRSKRADPGAEFHKRKGERATLRRLYVSVILTDVPLVLTSRVVSPQGESPFIGTTLLPELVRVSKLVSSAAAERDVIHPGFRGAAVSGDLAFNNTPFIERLYRHELEPNFDTRGWPEQKLIGKRLLTLNDGVEVVCDLANDGTLYCDCDRWENSISRSVGEPLRPRPLRHRNPMRQYRGRAGVNVHVSCQNPLCPRAGKKFYVALGRAADQERAGRLVPGPKDHTVITPLARADKRVAGIAFKGRQAIEGRHSMLQSHALLGKKRGQHRRVIHGDLPHQFWYGLADLVHNLTIVHNLAGGRCQRPEISWETLYRNKLRNSRAVAARKALGDGTKPPPERGHGPPAELSLAA